MTLQEKRPGPEWEEAPDIDMNALRRRLGSPASVSSAWTRGRFRAISTLEPSGELPKGGVGPQWLVSISRRGRRRPTSEECRRILRQFRMVGAEEDNHEPGIARKFWMPVDPNERVDCQCKADEEQVVEPDGYTWSRKRVG